MSNPEIPQPQKGQEGVQSPQDRFKSVMNTPSMTRRMFLGGVAGFAGMSVFGRETIPAQAQEVSSDSIDFATPSPTPEDDLRLKNVQNTEFAIDESLRANPQGLPIESISLNPNYSEPEAQNRLDVCIMNGLIRSLDVSEKYLQGEDYSALSEMMQKGNVPEEPNWAEYMERIQSDEPMMLKLMAMPVGAPNDRSSIQWMEADIRKGVKINYVAEPGPFVFQAVGPKKEDVTESWAIRVGDDGRLQYDIQLNNKPFSGYPDLQLHYNSQFSKSILHALQCTTTSLGIADHEGGWTLYGKNFDSNYSHIVNNVHYASLYPDQAELIVGDEVIYEQSGQRIGIGATNPIFQVNFAQ